MKLSFCTPASAGYSQAAEGTAAVMSGCHPDLPVPSWTPNALTQWLQILKVNRSPKPRSCLLPNARILPETQRCHLKRPCKTKKESVVMPRQPHHPSCSWSKVSERTEDAGPHDVNCLGTQRRVILCSGTHSCTPAHTKSISHMAAGNLTYRKEKEKK